MFFKSTGILGINARNLMYLRPFNEEKAIQLADDKLKTKAFLSARGISVPKLLGVIKNSNELSKFNFKKLPHNFVIKPNLGFGGEGIIPFIHNENQSFRTIEKKEMSLESLKSHIQDILNGNFSITNHKDTAFFEQLIVSDERIGDYSFKGLPDIRIIVHNLIPIMAMLRLPTRESGGKANLHQGAIGAGLDIAKGEVTHLVYKNRIIKEIPEVGSAKGLKIPFWDEILQMACKCQLATNLGYLAADIAIDKHIGPVLLEINARPGLSIQLANLAPLRSRLEKVEGIKVKNISKGIRIAKDMFGYTIEKDIKNLTGKKVIGLYEKVEIFEKENVFETVAFINTTRKKSSISLDLAHKLGYIKSKKLVPSEDLTIRTKLRLNGKKFTTLLKVEKVKKKKHQIILGTRDISERFLIDPDINKTANNNLVATKSIKFFNAKFDPEEIDQKLCLIDSHLSYISFLKPQNLKEETEKFKVDNFYNPQFTYPIVNIDFKDLHKDLKKIITDESDLGYLFKEKIKELETFIELIESRGSSDFSFISEKLFGAPRGMEFSSNKGNSSYSGRKRHHPKINSTELKSIFEAKLSEYNLNDWRVILKENLVANCVTNKDKKIFIKKSSLFSQKRVKSLIIHEIETHLLTAENGIRQKYKLFNRGFANYWTTQEGLAIYNSEAQSGESDDDFSQKTGLAEAIYLALHSPFSEVYSKLKERGLTGDNAFRMALRVKRGLTDTAKPGAFTKDYLYYRGRLEVKEFIENGGELKDLYYGKFNLKDLDRIKKIIDPSLTQILPKWLKN